MNTVWKDRLRRHWQPGVWILAFAVIGTLVTIFSLAEAPNTTIDFTKVTNTLANKPFSSTISTYGENGTAIITNAAQRAVLSNLKAGYYRVPLQWNNGNIQSSAGGHPSGTGDAWVTSVKSMGAEPQVVIGGSADNNFTPDEAAEMVRHFNKPASGQANRVAVWVIGNEPSNGGMSIQTYCSLFNQTVTKMKAIDPTIKVAGPAWSYFDMGTLNAFLQCAGNTVDIIDFHHYAMGGNSLSDATALNQTGDWENEVAQVKQAISQYAPTRAGQIEVQVGEYNWAWQTADGYNGWQGDDRFYKAINTVWGASVAGHIAKAGGRGHQYADLNGALGLTFEKGDAAAQYGKQLNDPMPIYYGLEMFTGGNLFRGFGSTLAIANTSLSNVEVYASNNGKNVVMINKSPTVAQTVAATLTGFTGGTADVWQTNQAAPFAAPTRKATLQNVTDSLGYSLPPYSVTTFVLNDGQTTPTPAPTPTYSCDSLTAQVQADNLTYAFSARATAANGATLANYTYSFGDQTPTVTGQDTVKHTYKPGTYTASVTANFVVNGQPVTATSKACTTTVVVAQPSTTPPVTLSVPIRINAGGGTYKDPAGNTWLADTNFSGGETDAQASGRVINGTTAGPLYQDERWGNFKYHLPVTNGTYIVRLHFAEIYNNCPKAGCRVFNVSANGAAWLDKFDVAAKVGANTADVEEKTLTVTQNAIDLSFTSVTGSPQIAAIEVLAPTTPTPAPKPASGKAIKGIASKCIDNQYGKMTNGNKIQLYTCNNTDAQKWTVQANGTITNANGYCLDAKGAGMTSGTLVQLYQCNSTAAQVWKVNTNGTITNPHANLCLDDKHSGTDDGTQIWLWSCNGTNAQKWSITE